MKFKSLTIALCTLGLVISVPAVKMALAEPLQRRIAQTESADTAEFQGKWKIAIASPKQKPGIMPPEQLPQHQENLASRRRINEVCDAKGPMSPYRVVDTLPESNSYSVDIYR